MERVQPEPTGLREYKPRGAAVPRDVPRTRSGYGNEYVTRSKYALEVMKIVALDVGADFITEMFDYISDLIYQKIIEFLGDFFGFMNSTGYALFEMPWVRQIVRFFGNLGWALFVVGIVVALFEFAIESQNGHGDSKALSLNIIKGFFAVNLFCNVPVQLYGFTVVLQGSLSSDMTGFISPEGSGTLLGACLELLETMMFDKRTGDTPLSW